MRRNLSGITLLYKFPNEQKEEVTCIEDCPDDTQWQWIKSMDSIVLQTITKKLLDTIHNIGEKFDITVESKKIDFSKLSLLDKEKK